MITEDVRIRNMEIKKTKEKNIVLVGKKETVLVDPEAWTNERIVLFTSGKKSELYQGGTIVISGPGEYEVGGVEVEGMRTGQSTAYVVTVDRVRIGIIGKLEETLTEKKTDRINELDVLIFDLSMKVSFKEIVKLAKAWGVNYLIPIDGTGEGKLKEFLDEMDEEGLEKVESFKVDRDELPDGMEVVLL